MRNGWLDGNKASFIPIFTIGVLVVVYLVFHFLFIRCSRGIAKCQPFNESQIFSRSNNNPIKGTDNSAEGQKKVEPEKLKLYAERHSRRFVWTFLIGVSTLLSIASLFAAFGLIHKSGSFGDENPATRTAVSMGLTLLVGVLFWGSATRWMLVMKNILDLTINNSDIEGAVPIVYGTMRVTNSLIYAAAFALVISACAILRPRKAITETHDGNERDAARERAVSGDASVDPAKKLSVISGQMKDLRVVLYVGTLLLVISVLLLNAVNQWSISFIPPDAVEAARSFYVGFSSVFGGFHSLILAAVYLPAAYVLQRRARQLAKELPPDQQEETLKSNGLTFSLRESMPRILAILGPLLAGPIGDLLKSVPAAI
jgi:hypothetical protein